MLVNGSLRNASLEWDPVAASNIEYIIYILRHTIGSEAPNIPHNPDLLKIFPDPALLETLIYVGKNQTKDTKAVLELAPAEYVFVVHTVKGKLFSEAKIVSVTVGDDSDLPHISTALVTKEGDGIIVKFDVVPYWHIFEIK